jgi:DNA-binding transcriptional LysR family regulator
MELRLLQTFVAVAELRHFARAADRCNLSQPAVSHQIRLLEEQLGTRLLNRDGRRVSLTVAGELFVEDARRILAAADRARERVQNVAAGTIGRVRIGATQTPGLYRLPAMLNRYRHSHPRFALQFTIASEKEILERVAANDLDMGVVQGKPVLGELKARPIWDEDMVIAAAAGASIGERRHVKPADLRDESWILPEEGSDARRELEAWLRRHRLEPTRQLTLHGPDAIKQAVVAGLGIAALPRVVVDQEIKQRRLIALKVSDALPPRHVLLVDHPQKHHGAACTAMIAMLTSQHARG